LFRHLPSLAIIPMILKRPTEITWKINCGKISNSPVYQSEFISGRSKGKIFYCLSIIMHIKK
jgi:hypothetical protein